MTTYDAHKLSAAEYADLFCSRGRLTFQDKKLRDEVFRILRKRNVKCRKTSIRNQLLHPEYVADYEGRVETGFGNTMYKTHFSALYSIEQECYDY